ncbi:MAG: 4-hydroxythreonine-4-phosphate dehydrogenase PdxA [bacterium]|nr:4-hydroxythreonine-4-phosphate dehydrogenase PdxA [bacterium]
MNRPLIALTAGDVAGIGPEIVHATLADEGVRELARVVVVGPNAVRPPGVEDFGSTSDVSWLDTPGPRTWRMGAAQAECGRAAGEALRAGAELAAGGRVQALVTAPVNKEALHLAGIEVEGQTELLARWAGVQRYEMVAIAGALRVMLLTRHMPLRAAIERVNAARVEERVRLFDETLRERIGIERPRIAVAGLNPHAGEGGILGSEDGAELAPAVADLRAAGLDVTGPVSPDTVFLQASEGAFDGVLALYHDQAFIPVKLLSQDRGLTVIAGLPYLRLSPVHGTAFDIAGTGTASAANLIHAVHTAAEMAMSAESDPRRPTGSGASG